MNVKKLPDSYAKWQGSNNEKLLRLNELAVADIKADQEALFNSLDLMTATGYTLDIYGDMVGQKRGNLNDDQYRYMILTRIAINTVQGNYESIIDVVTRIFNCKPSDIILRDGEKPCTVEVQAFPLTILVDAGFTSTQAIELIEQLLPICVTIDTANFEGTFEFADTADAYDEAKGFGNVEQTIGGYLGLLLGDDENSPVLPL